MAIIHFTGSSNLDAWIGLRKRQGYERSLKNDPGLKKSGTLDDQINIVFGNEKLD